MRKKLFPLVLCIFGWLFLSSCGGSKVAESEIISYLNSQYSVWDMSVGELNNIVQETGEAQNKCVITCTAVASNKYAEQTANWTLIFEQFEGEWVGTSGTIGYNEYRLINEISEEDFAQIAFYEYTPSAYFEILDLETDFETETAVAHILSYSFNKTFYGRSEGTAMVCWNPSTMHWEAFRQNVSLSNYSITLSTDLSVHFERQDNDIYETFDIIRESETSNDFILKNYYCNYNNYYERFMPYKEYKYELDDTILDFQNYSYGIGLCATIPATDSIHSREINVLFYIIDQTLYYVSPKNKTVKIPIKSDLLVGDYSEFTGLWKGTWQGEY